MLRIDLLLAEAREREAALRHSAHPRLARARPNAIRRTLGAWIVRRGRAVAGRPTSVARLA